MLSQTTLQPTDYPIHTNRPHIVTLPEQLFSPQDTDFHPFSFVGSWIIGKTVFIFPQEVFKSSTGSGGY